MTNDKLKKAAKRSLPREVRKAVASCQAKLAKDIFVLDLRDIASFTDFFIILHGNSDRQNLAISDHVERELRKDGFRPLGVEGRGSGDWILMDYGFFIIHVLSREKREFYALEKLWGDAPRAAY
ncbi:MAG: ribosome silencing factor [Candidatus Aminicenantes bacterium RBG_13_59_9]|nr:MAG: ribosome silencing factor [Candidatus Aminicenantes bacterium RBG_13_59_9]